MSGNGNGRGKNAARFAKLVEEHAHLAEPRAIARALWSSFGASLFEMFDPEWIVTLLSEQVRRVINRDRSGSIRVVSGHASRTGGVGSCRVAIGGDYWAKRWLVDGKYVATRDLTVGHLEWLIRDRTKVSEQARAQVLFFETNLALARRHRVKSLGDLERKGVELLEVQTLAAGALAPIETGADGPELRQ